MPPRPLQLCDEAVAAYPCDETTLNTLSMALKAVGRPQDITRTYEAACDKAPRNADLLRGLFAAHARCGGGGERLQGWR